MLLPCLPPFLCLFFFSLFPQGEHCFSAVFQERLCFIRRDGGKGGGKGREGTEDVRVYTIPFALQLFAFKLTVIMPPPPPPSAPKPPKGLDLGPIWVHSDGHVVRMPRCPPLFDPDAKGDPIQWEEHFKRTSGKKAFKDSDFLPWKDESSQAVKRAVSMRNLQNDIMAFLKVRPINCPLDDFPFKKKRKYNPVLDFLAKPEMKGDGWFRMRYKPNEAKTFSKKAYHGTRLYCVYCILVRGILYHSDASTRIIRDTSGVYAHEDKSRAEGYVAYNPLFSDGIFWGALLELGYSKVVPLKNDQLALQDAGLIAVWFHGARFGNVPLNRNISPRWDPLLEANPFDDDDDDNDS